jgi:hypothetical protein
MKNKTPKTTSQIKNESAKVGGSLSLVPNLSLLERQPKESTPAWEAYQVYLELQDSPDPKASKGLREVGRRIGKSGSLIARWSVTWKWNERIRLVQSERALQIEREQTRAIRAQAKAWAKRKIETRDLGYDVGGKLVQRGQALLALPVYEKKVEKKYIAKFAGEEIDQIVVYNFQQHPRDAKPMIEAGMKLMRLSADMPTDNINLHSKDVDLDNMTEEEIEAYLEELERIRAATAVQE